MRIPTHVSLGGAKIPRDRVLGIGEFYGWQVPLYRDLVARAIERIKGVKSKA